MKWFSRNTKLGRFDPDVFPTGRVGISELALPLVRQRTWMRWEVFDLPPLASSGSVSTFHIQAVRLNKGEELLFFLDLTSQFYFFLLNVLFRLSWRHQMWTSAHRKAPRCCFNTGFSSPAPAAWLRIHIFQHYLSAREVKVTLEREGGDHRVDGLIPLMRRRRLKSSVRHKQTWCRLKLPPPTYPAATLQLFWNQSKIKSAALFMHQTERFLCDIPGVCVLKKKKINILCCYLKSDACRLLSDSSMLESESGLTWSRWELC